MSIYRLDVESGTTRQSGQLASSPGLPREQLNLDSTEAHLASDQVLVSGSIGKTFDDLQLRNAQLNGLAGSIRQSDRAAELLGQKIDALKAPLEIIVKNFPPFSQEDKERVELLKSYSFIRKEIDSLTVPAPPEVIAARKAEALPETLPSTVDDSQIADHLSKLDAAASALDEFRRDLAGKTASFLEGSGFVELWSRPNAGENAQKRAVLSESKAPQVSAEVGRQFAISSGQGVAQDDHSQFLKGLS